MTWVPYYSTSGPVTGEERKPLLWLWHEPKVKEAKIGEKKTPPPFQGHTHIPFKMDHAKHLRFKRMI